MTETKTYIMEQVKMLEENNIPIPEDVIADLRKVGIFLDEPAYASSVIDAIKAEVEAIKLEVTKPPPETPIAEVNFSPLIDKLDALIALLSVPTVMPAPQVTVNVPEQKDPQVIVNVPEQKEPVVNFKPVIKIEPKQTAHYAKVERDNSGLIIGIREVNQ